MNYRVESGRMEHHLVNDILNQCMLSTHSVVTDSTSEMPDQKSLFISDFTVTFELRLSWHLTPTQIVSINITQLLSTTI